jgi:hypothetical protein
MISNLNPTNSAHLARKWSCVWRPDVGSRLYARGSWQAAGGVAGLAWLQTGLAQTATMYTYQSVSGNAEVHIPMMDHMGNVRHYYQIKATGSAGPSPATVPRHRHRPSHRQPRLRRLRPRDPRHRNQNPRLRPTTRPRPRRPVGRRASVPLQYEIHR